MFKKIIILIFVSFLFMSDLVFADSQSNIMNQHYNDFEYSYTIDVLCISGYVFHVLKNNSNIIEYKQINQISLGDNVAMPCNEENFRYTTIKIFDNKKDELKIFNNIKLKKDFKTRCYR